MIIVTPDVVVSPAMPDGVAEDLPGLLDTATEALRAAGCLLVYGGLDGEHLSVDAGTWTAEDLAERRADLADADLSAPELAAATAALDDAEGRLAECASLRLSVVANGVVHDFTFLRRLDLPGRTRAAEHVRPGARAVLGAST